MPLPLRTRWYLLEMRVFLVRHYNSGSVVLCETGLRLEALRFSPFDLVIHFPRARSHHSSAVKLYHPIYSSLAYVAGGHQLGRWTLVVDLDSEEESSEEG